MCTFKSIHVRLKQFASYTRHAGINNNKSFKQFVSYTRHAGICNNKRFKLFISYTRHAGISNNFFLPARNKAVTQIRKNGAVLPTKSYMRLPIGYPTVINQIYL